MTQALALIEIAMTVLLLLLLMVDKLIARKLQTSLIRYLMLVDVFGMLIADLWQYIS